jgi:hypothetical protein
MALSGGLDNLLQFDALFRLHLQLVRRRLTAHICLLGRRLDMDQRWARARLIKRDGTMKISVGAREMTLTEAAAAAGINPNALRTRLRGGWPVGEALTAPMGAKRQPPPQG